MVRRRAQQLAQGRCLDARGPQGHGRFHAANRIRPAGFSIARTNVGDAAVEMDFNAQLFELFLRLGRQVLGIGGEQAIAAIEQQHLGLGGVDVAEVAAHVVLGDIADGAGQFHAGGPAADDHEVERRMPAVLLHVALGQLEREQYAAADFGGVLQGFEARRQIRPLLVAEVGMGGAGGQHQVVVRHLLSRWRAPARGRRCRCRPPRPSAPECSAGGEGLCGWVGRYRRARARPEPPGRAAAGRCGGCGGR